MNNATTTVPCWLVVEPPPGQDLRSGRAQGASRFTIHHATEAEAHQVAKHLGTALGGGTPTQVGVVRLKGCEVCAGPDDDTALPPKHRVEILTPRGWTPTADENGPVPISPKETA